MRLLDLDLAGEARPRERGIRHGRELAAHVRAACDGYERLFAHLGISPAALSSVAEGARDALADACPDLLAEAEGVAEGAGLPAARVLLLDARTEALALAGGQPECSTLVLARPGRAPRSVQTWDWHAWLAPVGVMLRVGGAEGRRIRMFTEPGMLAKIGVSTAGLGLHFNILQHASARPRDGGVPVHALARLVLERASSVAEAIELCRSTPVAASSVLTVLDRTGDVASIEVAPAGIGVVRPEGGVLAHTNHFLDPVLAPGDRVAPASTTAERLAHLRRVAPSLDPVVAPGELLAVVTGGADDAPICMREDPALPELERWSTLLTCAIDVERAELLVRAGAPGAGPFERSAA